ncbi:MAG: ABC transporter permease [Clostridia bacterium]|nr:ABC transporter permease [Clostridia bacterium]
MKNLYSEEHLKFLKREKRKSFFVTFSQIAILVLFLGLWEILTATGLVDGFLFSSPSRIVTTAQNLAVEGELFTHIFTTLYETLLGFFIATSVGLIIAVLLWWSDLAKKIFEPYLVVMNSLPKIALGPLIIIWFGAGVTSIIFMTVIITIIVTIINLLTGFCEVDDNKILLLKSMGANKFQIFNKLIFPATIPNFISTLKINVGMSWIGSIMGEYLVSKQGIGYLIVYGGQVFKLDLVMTSTVILCILAAVMYFLVVLIEKLLVKWK